MHTPRPTSGASDPAVLSRPRNLHFNNSPGDSEVTGPYFRNYDTNGREMELRGRAMCGNLIKDPKTGRARITV